MRPLIRSGIFTMFFVAMLQGLVPLNVYTQTAAATIQYKVRIIVQETMPPGHDSIYITGNFNNWNAGDANYKLGKTNTGDRSITLQLSPGMLEYKFTRGNWLNVEKNHLCGEVENRKAGIHRDTTIYVKINFWMDECSYGHLKGVVKLLKQDTSKVNALLILGQILTEQKDSVAALSTLNEALTLAEQLNFQKGKGIAMIFEGELYAAYRDFPKARNFFGNAIKIQEKIADKSELAASYLAIASTYASQDKLPEYIEYSYTAIKYYEMAGNKFGMALSYLRIGDYNLSFSKYSEAKQNYLDALRIFSQINSGDGTWGIASANRQLAEVISAMGDYNEALSRDSIALKIFSDLKLDIEVGFVMLGFGGIYVKQADAARLLNNDPLAESMLAKASTVGTRALRIFEQGGDPAIFPNAWLLLGNIKTKQKNLEAARGFLTQSLHASIQSNNKARIVATYRLLMRLDSTAGDFKQAFEHHKKLILYRDSVVNIENSNKALQAKLQYQFDKKEAETAASQIMKDAEVERAKNKQYLVITLLTILAATIMIIAFILQRNNKQKQKTNAQLRDQKEKVETTLLELKATQSQLIQSEKMASLGELTAGIAHEIQNPLNFVNNFSELSNELIDEMKVVIQQDNKEDALAIADDIKQNLAKINHHGKRADSIVKGMLQHSRASTGTKVMTDINLLANEYIRLCNAGLKARDKSFNATIRTDLETSLANINIIPQDIGRVLLNLLTNALYAVNEKEKLHPANYEPMVSISTRQSGKSVEVIISDNGNGISKTIINKIFQPFFTTKPTGEGTGLGLSLSYDIVKAHGGEIKVESEEGKGSSFFLTLPVA